MKALLSSRPVLWFLFLFNLTVALAAPLIDDSAQGIATSLGMAVVSVGAGLGLLKGRK
ncbi:hypothetical protein OG607_01550 [Streptomyces sp. NBC_01537]|uniref:hypothetical protein n=1 Tax=Streptomyces sp. NBC_01537 TaxID=2903896 RepID=UPI0038650A49